ncbi:MAG: HAD family hydrolase [Treponema sp.]|nr:HAD family hydrolase [Treponema sp.]
MNEHGARYKKQKDFLVCIDSDGCAMDTMNVKHVACFGPKMVAAWKLEAHSDALLAKWNKINLFSQTRGINRYKALALILSHIDSSIEKIDGLAEFTQWVASARALSNDALSDAINEAEQNGKNSTCMKKALAWSGAVNDAIAALDISLLVPFEGVLDALAKIHDVCDIAVVSSANRAAVEEEWQRTGLVQHVDSLLCQDAGAKAACIATLLQQGYAPAHVLMIGDSPGDLEAAQKNGVHFYPVLVKKETESWMRAYEAVLHLADGTYEGAYEDELIASFQKNLADY